MDYTAFLRSAECGQLPPLVLIHGPDPQLLDDALAAATRGLFPDPSLAAFGREVLDGRETPAEAIVTSAMTLPLMTAGRLVAVRHAQALPARAAAIVGEYARNPNPSTCALFLAEESLEGGRDAKAHWLVRALPRAGIVALPVRRGRDLEAWLKERAAIDGIELSDEASRLLVTWVGDDTAALLGEARKAALAGGADHRTVGVREVTAVVGEHRMAGVFDLARAIERRDIGLALRTLDRLLVTEDPMRLLAMLTSEVRVAWSIQELSRRGQSVAEIARAVRRPPGVVASRLGASEGRSTATWAPKLRRCWDVEMRLKSGGQARSELTALVAELCD